MRRAILTRLFPALCLFLAGCITVTKTHVPNYGPQVAPVPVPPTLVLVNVTRNVGGDVRRPANINVDQHFRSAVARVLETKSPVPGASEAPTDPVSYVITLDASTQQTGQAWVVASVLLSALLFPAVLRTDYSVTASVFEAGTGRMVGAYDASTSVEHILDLMFLPVTPMAFFTQPGDEYLYDETVRDALAQVAVGLRARELPSTAVDPASVVVPVRTGVGQMRR